MRFRSSKMRNYPYRTERGFTLAELMIAAMILAVVLVGLLVSFITCLELAEISKNTSLAMNAIQTRLEQIRDTKFTDIKSTYHQQSFTPADLDGMGVSYVDDTDSQLLLVTVSVSWQQGNGRVIGEDTDRDGAIDAGEDIDLDGMLNSPAEVVTYIAQQ